MLDGEDTAAAVESQVHGARLTGQPGGARPRGRHGPWAGTPGEGLPFALCSEPAPGVHGETEEAHERRLPGPAGHQAGLLRGERFLRQVLEGVTGMEGEAALSWGAFYVIGKIKLCSVYF